jgi:hypothetical protein
MSRKKGKNCPAQKSGQLPCRIRSENNHTDAF